MDEAQFIKKVTLKKINGPSYFRHRRMNGQVKPAPKMAPIH